MADLLKTPAAWPAILLGRAGAADPTDLDAAARAGAFDGLRRAIRDLGATGTIATIGASGLRGRGGSGFPTAEKWRTAATHGGAAPLRRGQRLRCGPGGRHRPLPDGGRPVLGDRGAAIAAFAVGATEAIIAVRSEATETIRRLEAAIAAAEEAGFIGFDAFGSGRDLTVTVRGVQGAYMLGEETVLLKALEGKRGQPEQRPPHPAERGLHGMPTVVNNVQTLAAVPWIIRHGAPAFAATGRPGNAGTILVQVRTPAGAGIAEVPLGTPLRAVVALGGALPKAAPSRHS